MIFSSPKFILLFLPIAFFGYFFLNRNRLILAGKAWLVVVSLFFYAYWNIAYLPILLGSILFNFAVGTRLSSALERESTWLPPRVVLAGGIAANLALLVYFTHPHILRRTTDAA